ncbi:MAG TPA: anti-sigma factor [Solirubrobacteraceae bacterium]|nr:anti-sigma factor [Solirubrobacteraceae bacterium]
MSGEDRIANGHRCGDDAAAYVLGALEPSEVDAFRAHLVDCAACQKEVAEFEQVTGALPESAAQLQVPKDLRRRVMSEVRATPKAHAAPLNTPVRSWHPAFVWGGAFAAAAVVLVVLVVALSSGGSGTKTIQASTGSAELRITRGHGDLIVHRLPALPAGRIYEMWVQRGSATPTPTGTLFAVTRSGSAAVGVPGSLDGISAVMVTEEPAGGTSAPTTAPVIVARLT